MKTQLELQSEFKDYIQGKNLMTPDIIRYEEIPNGVVEISKGRGFNTKPIYGFTFLINGKLNHNINQCFRDLNEGIEYLNKIKGELNEE